MASFSPSSASITARRQQARLHADAHAETSAPLVNRYRFRAEEFVDRAHSDEVEFGTSIAKATIFTSMNTKKLRAMQMSREAGRKRLLPDSHTIVKVEFFEEKSHRRGLARYHGHESDPDRTTRRRLRQRQ